MANTRRIQEDIEALRRISEPCEDGITRIGFTPEYRRGVSYIGERMREAGLLVREDGIGNIYGRLEGEDHNAPVILSGSHLDTVRCAGAFDGVAGVACALEAARMLRENGKTLRHNFEVIGLVEEEGTRFGQVLLGSQFVTGTFADKELDAIRDPDGTALREVLAAYLPEDTCPVYRDDSEIKAFLELHDEQGPVLEAEGADIGIVQNIVSISWLTVTVTGFAGHAGTVPMPLRQDAATGACRLIDRVSRHVTEHYADSATTTVGRLELVPGSTNCIPSKCVFTVDLRSGAYSHIQDITGYIREQAVLAARECGVKIDVHVDSLKESVAMDPGLQETIRESCRALGYRFRDMNSGAGHDAMVFSRRWPSAMLFVPCVKGVTHNPAEHVHGEALEKGTNVLYETILRVDQQ